MFLIVKNRKMTFICNQLLMFVLCFGQYDTKYYYEVGLGNTTRQFWFTTPPEIGPDVPYTFGLIGKLHSIKQSLRYKHVRNYHFS
jgi:hypothetical protein